MDSAIQQIADRVCSAATRGTPLRIRGGGSKDFYGQSLQGELLDTTGLTGITSYEPSELVVTARAGTPLRELEAALAEQGQCLPFEPPHFALQRDGSGDRGHANGSPAAAESTGSKIGQATVGGMVAAGLSGPARASVGGVRDYMLGVQLLNGRGEHLTFGGQVMKNVAGYDVSRLIAGSLGTLGVITEVSLKVLPVAPAEATLVFELDQAGALAQLHRWGGQPLPLNASCWVHDGATGKDLLHVRLRGAIAAVESASKSMAQQAGGKRMDNAVAAPDWQACRDLRLPFFADPPQPDMALWRLSVAQTASVLNLPWPQLVEWHGGLRWLWAPRDAADRLREAAVQAGGNASIFIANYQYPTLDRGQFDGFSALNPPLDAIHRRLKAEFDPAGVFNRGRLFRD
jgi:glycolate oxidase FAD binding subunit